ncbi:MAG: deoxyribonuclease IV [Pirellulaceae bacterium]
MDESRPILGAHMSMAGGFHKAVERGVEVGCHCVQVFVKNNNRWTAPDLTDADVEQLSAAMVESGLRHLLAHSSYLINLASPERALWNKSIDALVVELQRAERLSIPYVVLHPGAYTSSSEEAGLRQVIRALDEVQRQTRDLDATCLLENTAGQGTCLGWRFEQLATLLEGVQAPERLGVCFDTCHAFAAGYALATEPAYRQTMRQLQRLVGLDRIKAVHVNDSKREFGSRVDRHEHIGRGQVGIQAFARLLNDRRFQKIPMYLETPKGEDPQTKKPWDEINLRQLRRLVGRPVT